MVDIGWTTQYLYNSLLPKLFCLVLRFRASENQLLVVVTVVVSLIFAWWTRVHD